MLDINIIPAAKSAAVVVMTVAAGLARWVIGKIVGADRYCMGMACVRGVKRICMTGGTIAAGGKGLEIGAIRCYQGTVAMMTARAAVMHLGITRIGQRRRCAVTVCTDQGSYIH